MEGDPGIGIDVASAAIHEDKDKVGRGCLLLVLVLAAIVVAGSFALIAKAEQACAATSTCVETGTNGGNTGSAHLERVTPLGTPSDAASGPSSQDAHLAAAKALTPGDGGGGSTNSPNPEQARQTTPTTAHTDTQVPTPEAPPPPPSPPPSCDSSDPHGGCYVPPECDPDDPASPCYQPPDLQCPPPPGEYYYCTEPHP